MISRSSSCVWTSFAAGAAMASVLIFWNNKRKSSKTTEAEAEIHCWKIIQHSFTGALIYVMDDLGLYDQLLEPATVKELASRTGYSERWLLELLCQSTGAGICQHHTNANQEDTFSLKPAYAKFLLRPEKKEDSLIGMFRFLRGLVMHRPDATIQAVKTGVGVDYDFDTNVVDGIEQKNRNFFRNKFIPDILAQVRLPEDESSSSLMDLLERGGAKVADIGCGCGTSTIAMAHQFPKSHFFAYEASTKSLERLEKQVQALRLTNVTLCNVNIRPLSEGPYPGQKDDPKNYFDFVYSHDLIHDMTNPRALIREVKGRLAKTGCWVIVDVKCHEHLSQNLAMPSAALNYGFSCLLCLSSATSTRDGEGLGTMGFHSMLARQWMTEAGFEHFSELEIKSKPDNSCFVVA